MSLMKKEQRFFLAESITPSEDYLTYTLEKLKSGLKWHDERI